MAVPKKDQERITYAWMYGSQASKDGQERVVPEFWLELSDTWLQGFDGAPLIGTERPKAISDAMEAEVDEAGVGKPPGA